MGYNGKLAERLKASDCKSDSRMRYGGSNPSLTTYVRIITRIIIDNFIHYCINYDWCIFWCHNNGVLTEWKCRGLQNHC